METNTELKYQMHVSGVSQWMIADVIGVSENTINRWLRHELTPEKKEAVMNAIETCKQNRKKEGALNE